MNYSFKLRSKYIWVGLSTLILVGIFLVLLKPADVLNAVSQVGWFGLLQIFVLVAVTQIIRASRFFELLSLRINIQYALVFKITCIYQLFNHILPVRSGELSFPFLLKRYSGCTYSSSVASLLLTRLHDALALAVLVCFGAAVLIYQGRIESFWLFSWILILLLALLLISLLVVWFYKSQAKRRKHNIKYINSPHQTSFLQRFASKLKGFAINLFNEIFNYQGFYLHLRLFGYSIVLWLVLFIIFWQVLQLVGFNISFAEVILGSCLSNLTQLLPINTFGNIGTLEAGWVLGFALLGFDSYKTLTAGIVMHILVIIAAATYGLGSWITLAWIEKIDT